MDFIFSEIERCLKADAWYAAIAIALTLPSICAVAGDTENRNHKSRMDRTSYITWVDSTNLPIKYDKNIGQQLYGLRCSILHEGTWYAGTEDLPRLLVVGENPNLKIHNCILSMPNETVVIHDAKTLCADIVDAAKRWKIANTSNEKIMNKLNRVVSRYPNGMPPFVIGVPVFG